MCIVYFPLVEVEVGFYLACGAGIVTTQVDVYGFEQLKLGWVDGYSRLGFEVARVVECRWSRNCACNTR